MSKLQNNMKGFFITGTNTDRGKTLITTALFLWLQQQSQKVLAMKPIQTGMGENMKDKNLAIDLQPIVPHIQIPHQDLLPLMQPYCYQAACSPHLAAELEQLPAPSIAYIVQCAQQLSRYCDALLVEGAGGLLVPIDRKQKLSMIDVAEALRLPIIFIAQSGLGSINDSLLALREIIRRKLPLAGFILNDLQASSEETEYICADNARVICEFTGVPYLGRMPYISQHNLCNKSALLLAVQQVAGVSQLIHWLKKE